MTKEERTGWMFVTMALKSHDDQHDEERRDQVGYLDIAIFVTMASKSQDDQHDDKGEYRLDILMLGYW